jgi:hypothetical protein
MTNELLDTPAEASPRAVKQEYIQRLAALISRKGISEVVATTGLDKDTVTAVATQSGAELSLADAAAIAALANNAPDADTIISELRDTLLLEMSSAMLTVDRLATELALDLDPKEIQAKIEGRQPMTLGEYAQLRHYLASQQ